ncbi:PRTRC genetic system protein C [Chryseobacterium sp. 52]|uniref:PRTRC system protein C n=1 Tax=Chryseobacterium sp. 52 TaxID=2035213 RepID=UPI000C19D3E5|nr:PRTRC system protein C [Chryseobacterium sp. 52]PIF45359.1 PRTRC genetic system protein C [Chryseobacterium sp. 52]
MLLATALERIFIVNDNGQEITLTDPEPNWSAETVLNFFSGKYPILTTATISKPKIKDDRVEIRFESVMGTKG